VAEIEPRVANRFFNLPASYVIEGWPTFSWFSRATPTGYWASARDFLRAARRDDPGFRELGAALYDPEPWPATPRAEQQNPAGAMARFSKAARKAGLRVIVTPQPRLVAVEGAACGRSEGETVEDAFIRCGIMADAARVADVVEIQSQSLQSDPEAYREFTEEAARQAREANPKVLVISGLVVRSPEIEGPREAWLAVRDVVDGHYVSMDPADAEPLLAWIASCADGPVAGSPGADSS
jgi:hypothetical protein